MTADPNSSPSKGAYAFISLGCPKNLVDSERMLGRLQADGYRLVMDPERADFVVVNTCGFIDAARQESLGAIDEMLELKRRGAIRGVIVAGCLAERQRESLRENRPDIDALIGVFGREEIVRVAHRMVSDLREQQSVFQPAPLRTLPDGDRLRVTPPHFAYLKISEGCDRLCTFCAIPKMRGKHVSKSEDEVIAETEQLAADGVRELVVVAQDTTYYGMDVDGQPKLAGLLQRLEKVDGIDWIRLMYFYPQHVTDPLLGVMRDSAKILPYLDLPLQHINDEMLRRMARRVTRRETEALLQRLREAIPRLALRTTFITGFPGETEAQFDELMEFAAEQRFERVGVFTYSLEHDTPAARLAGHLPDEVKAARRDRLMQLQQDIAFQWSQDQAGVAMDVILDRPAPDASQKNVWVGRSPFDAPEIDGSVYVTGHQVRLTLGDIVPCEIVASQGYDLVGVATDEPRRRTIPGPIAGQRGPAPGLPVI